MKIDIKKLVVEQIKENRLEEYIDLLTKVKKSMEYTEWLGDFSKEDYIFLINNNSQIYAWFYGNQMIAAGVIIPSRPKDLDKFFSSDLNYKEVIDFGPEMVHPDYIGNGLQNIILNYLQRKSKEQNYKYAISTIHPDNTYSIRNFVNNNFEILGSIELKRGPRNVYRKKL